MSKFVIVLAIMITIISLTGLGYLYYFYERPAQEQGSQYSNLNILAFDLSKKQIKTGYLIYINGNLIENDTTDETVAIQKRVPKNRTITVHNYNLKGQQYYIDIREISTFKSTENHRVSLNLYNTGNIQIEQYGTLGQDNPIILNLSTDNVIKNFNFCIEYSKHIIYIRTNDEFRRVDNCFYIDADLNEADKGFIINLKYNFFDKIDNNDSIKITFFDEYSVPFSQNLRKTAKSEYIIKN